MPTNFYVDDNITMFDIEKMWEDLAYEGLDYYI